MSTTSQNAKETKCPSCKTNVQADVKFCQDCGAPVKATAAEAFAAGAAQTGTQSGALADGQSSGVLKLLANPMLVILLGSGLIFAAGYMVSQRGVQSGAMSANPNAISTLGRISAPSMSSSPAAAPGSASSAPQGSPQNIDLASMTPRQAADRLFNRIMAADENGDIAQAKRFAPMAVQAYAMVQQMDGDGQFHVGLIQLVQGNGDDVRKQIEILRRDTPNHLLALALEYKLAKRDANNKSAEDILARFGKVYAKEIASGKEEYTAHKITIDKLRAAAKS